MIDKITATTGDVFGFDFNKEIHYIEKDRSRKDKDQLLRVPQKTSDDVT